MSKVKYTSKQYQRIFGRVIDISKNSSNTSNNSNGMIKRNITLFNVKEPVLSESIELNVLNAFVQGYYINLIKNNGIKYQTCFPSKKTYARPDRSSYLSLMKQKAKYGIYTLINSIAANEYFTMVSRVPPSIINEIKEKKVRKIILGDCLVKSKSSNNKKERRKYSKKTGKISRKRSKKR